MDHLLILPIHSFWMLLIKLSCLLLQLSYKTSSQALFPDNAYGVDSGGDPKVIPKLTFEEFKVYSLLHFDFYFFFGFMLVWGFFNLNVVLVIFLRLSFWWQEFHRKYYHPSNARIWFYGDDDPNERLRIPSGNKWHLHWWRIEYPCSLLIFFSFFSLEYHFRLSPEAYGCWSQSDAYAWVVLENYAWLSN